jgi:hypothetical protein
MEAYERVTPVEVKEIVYQSVPYVGIANVGKALGKYPRSSFVIEGHLEEIQ